MRPFNGKGSQLACWLKLPFLCLIAVTLAFAMVVLVAPLVSTMEAKFSSDDPSWQLIRDPFKIEAEVLSITPKIEEPVEIEEVSAKEEDEEQATTGSSSASELLLQLPSRQEMECDFISGPVGGRNLQEAALRQRHLPRPVPAAELRWKWSPGHRVS